ncbi:MAG: hypothetical protein L7S62_01570 [Flavobacteriales bacterium]|jgi:hypothetical protein|nr:hypothetical protein [Flavobacteriales bacterium]
MKAIAKSKVFSFMMRWVRRFPEGEDAPFLMKNPHHREGDADFRRNKNP